MNTRKVINNTIRNIKENTGAGGRINDLLNKEVLTEIEKDNIYRFFYSDLAKKIKEYVSGCNDTNKQYGMFKCSLETWQACCDYIGRDYFRLNNYLVDKTRSGKNYRDDLLIIGLEVYEHFCKEYRKQFFIYDAALFLGIDRNVIYELNTSHSDLLKKAHTMQESSMRTALASGRSNVTAMAILLNHDYNYTRTTEIIHTSDTIKTADTLPKLNDMQTIEEKRSNEIM